MSRTLDELVRVGLVRLWAGDLGPRRMPNRRLYLSKEFEAWAEELSTEKPSGRLLAERVELDAVLAEFVAGRPLSNVILDVNPPAGEGIKKLKTQRFRLWGWAPAAQTLVLVLGARKDDIVRRVILEKDLGKQALALRNGMGVNESAKGHWSELFRAT